MNLRAVYPNPDDPSEEMSIEELRASARGWADKTWVAERGEKAVEDSESQKNDKGLCPALIGKPAEQPLIDIEPSSNIQEVSEARVENTIDDDIRSQKNGRTKKTKIREVRAETQTSIVLSSIHKPATYMLQSKPT